MKSARSLVLLLAFRATTSCVLAQESPFPKPEAKGAVDWTESPIKPEIAGFVRYSQGMGAPSPILVRLETKTGTLLHQTWTGKLGEFSFPEVACGYYVLAIDASGYKPVRMVVEHSFIPAGTLLLYLVPGEKNTLSPEDASTRERALPIPEPARREYEKGLRGLSEKKAREGVGHFRRAIHLYADYDDAYVQLGWVYLQEGAYPEARQTLENAIRRNDKNAAAHALLGSVERKQNRHREAVQELERSLELEEASWRPHLELGEILVKLGDVDRAYPHAVRAHELHPTLASVHLQLYNTLILGNDFKGAVAELEEFLRLFPTNSLVPRVKEQRAALLVKLQESAH